jgi:multiple sugar transport system substrate-binding protein
MDDIHEQLADTSAIKEHYGKDINPDIWTGITFDGKPKGIPWAVVYCSIWYNKAMFDRLGLSEPKTWEEFLNVCTKIKASGAYPLGAGGMNVSDNWTPYIWFSELVMKTDPNLYFGLLNGTVKWNEPRILKIFEIWKGMYDKGWFIDPNISMYSDLPKAIAREECAMILIADYYTSNLDNVGLVSGKTYSTFIFPPLNPDVGNLIVAEPMPILIPKNTPNLKAALEWCDYLMGPVAQTEWAKLWGGIPLNAKADFSVLAPASAKLARDIKEGNYKFMPRFEESVPEELRQRTTLKNLPGESGTR